MTPHAATLLFQIVVLVFALSLHEAAHAWMASREGDQTARMLGRVTLNPAKHIDPIGTVLVPAILYITHAGFLFGWAKPTPVVGRNFVNYRRGDILTTLAGPASNLLSAIIGLLLLIVLRYSSSAGAIAVVGASYAVQLNNIDAGPAALAMAATPTLFPIALLLSYVVFLNLFLAIFNLLPLPPLDGSHILKHYIPQRLTRVYDSLGLVSVILIFMWGGRVVNFFMSPILGVFDRLLGL